MKQAAATGSPASAVTSEHPFQTQFLYTETRRTQEEQMTIFTNSLKKAFWKHFQAVNKPLLFSFQLKFV